MTFKCRLRRIQVAPLSVLFHTGPSRALFAGTGYEPGSVRYNSDNFDNARTSAPDSSGYMRPTSSSPTPFWPPRQGNSSRTTNHSADLSITLISRDLYRLLSFILTFRLPIIFTKLLLFEAEFSYNFELHFVFSISALVTLIIDLDLF